MTFTAGCFYTEKVMRNYIKWMSMASEGNRLRLTVCCFLNILRAMLSLFFIWCTKILTDIATGHSERQLTVYLAFCIASMLVQVLLSAATTRISARTEIRMRNRLRHLLFTHIMESRWQGRGAMHTGDIMNRIESDVRTLTSVVCKSLPAGLTVTVQFAAAAYMMAAMDWRILLCIVFLMPIAVVAGKIHFRKIRSLSRNILDTGSKVQSHIQENIQHRTLMSTMEMVPEMSGELSSIQSSLEKQVMERTDYSLFSKTIVQLGFSAGYLTVFIWCITGLMNGSMTFGMMTAFIQLVSQVQRPVVDMGRILPSAINAAVSAERLSELLELPAEDSVPAVRFGNTAGIRFDNVSFSYKDGDTGKEIISGFSHDFRPGSITAVTGETGAGKSTLVRLILALIKPDKGKVIFYDGAKSAEASSGTRCNIIYVPQGNSLISGTIRTNLLLGKPDATDEEMLEALHNAVADFVLGLPEGLDTACSESGRGLSEGQAQRIAIARGMLREGGIIILDEPTSALDGDTEQALLSRLSENSFGKTIIIVSHSDTVARFCHDRIRLERSSD